MREYNNNARVVHDARLVVLYIGKLQIQSKRMINNVRLRVALRTSVTPSDASHEGATLA